MKVVTPKIDKRSFNDLLNQSKALAPFYTPEWVTGQQGEPGQALLNIYLHMQEQILRRLNRVPDKNFVAFLDMMGMKLLPAQSALAAVTFTLATGTTEHVRVPKGTLLSGEAADGSGEVIFQTQKDQLVTPAILQGIFSYDAEEDNIYEHTQDDKDPKPFTVFAGQNKQERSLYIGHADLLNQKKPTAIKVDFLLSEAASDGSDLELIWEYFDSTRWVEIARFKRHSETHEFDKDDGTLLFTKSGTMELRKGHTGEIAETEIGSNKNRWIRCRLGRTLPGSVTIELPEINSITISVNPIEPFAPDLAFNNDIPLNLETIRLKMLAMDVPLTFAAQSPAPQDADRKTIFVDHPELLIVGDFLKLDNTFESVEIREIVAKPSGNKIELNEPLSYNYNAPGDPRSNLTLYTALRRDGTSVKVESLEGIEISENSKVILYHRGNKEIDSIAAKFIITDQSILGMKAEKNPDNTQKIPDAVLDKLKLIKDQEFIGEKEFLERVIEKIGAIDANKFKPELLKYNRVPSEKDTLILRRESEIASRPFYIQGDVIDISPKIKPFGELPLIFDTFYIASDEAFSKKGAKIKLDIKAELNPPLSTDTNPGRPTAVLSWEFWNGKSWRGIRVNDTTDRFSKAGNVIFTCPDEIEKVEVNGEEKFWIRVRIVDGDYGKDILVEPTGGTIVNIRRGSIQFPIISDLTIDYENVGKLPQKCLTSNNLNLEDHTEDCIDENKTFAPFTIMPEQFTSLFLGFDKALVGGPLSILFNVKEQFLGQDETLKMLWFYWNGGAWTQLNVLDETEDLTKIGLLEFAVGMDFAVKKLFGKDLFWLKGSVVNGEHPNPLQINSLHPNTTYALQSDIANNEIAGSSNGTANQEFSLQHPLVISQQVLVREPILPPEEELETIRKEEGKDAIQEKKNELGDTIEILIRWREVEDFDDSDSKSRHYTIDQRLGKIKFGDGTHGMVPPVGASNLIVSYTFGGGKKGNVPVGAITGLKSAVPFVNAVTNPLAADGGSETETLDNVLRRAPLLLKNRDRAVMPEDFEALAKSASRKVARAKCLPNTDEDRNTAPGWVTVMIVPEGSEAKPEPSQLLIKVVKEGLEKHSANVVSWPGHIHVTGPDYTEVTVKATVVPTSLDKAAAVETAAKEKLNRYIHPLTGGPHGTGWEFGQGICLSDIFALIEGIEDTDHVEKVVLQSNNKSFEENVPLDKYSLPVSGQHEISITLDSSQSGFDPCRASKTDCDKVQEFKRVKCEK
jgi:hypothetical protein